MNMHSLCFYVCRKVAGDDPNNYKHFMQWLRSFPQQQGAHSPASLVIPFTCLISEGADTGLI